MSISQNHQTDKTRQTNKFKYDETTYLKTKANLDKLAQIYSLNRDEYKNELSYISRIILLKKYGKNHMSHFLFDFENYFGVSVDGVFRNFKGDKNNLSIQDAVIIAIGIIDDYFVALALLESAGFPFKNIEYTYYRNFLKDFYSHEDNLSKNVIERINSKKDDLMELSSH